MLLEAKKRHMYPTFVIASVCLAETFTRIGGSFLKNKEICRETTTRGSGKMGLAYMALLAICCSWAYEGFRFNSTGVISPVGMGLNFLWLGLWIWKVFYRYEVILRQNELEIVSIGLWKQGSYKVDLSKRKALPSITATTFSVVPASSIISTVTIWRMPTPPASLRLKKEKGWLR